MDYKKLLKPLAKFWLATVIFSSGVIFNLPSGDVSIWEAILKGMGFTTFLMTVVFLGASGFYELMYDDEDNGEFKL